MKTTIIFIAIVVLFFILLVFRKEMYYESYYDPKIDDLKQKLTNVFPSLKNIDITASNKSFTINKKTIYLCIKDENGRYYNENMLVYVLLHELAHVICNEIGHTEKYKTIFKSLLDKASLHGLYDPNKPPIENYCKY